MGLCFDEAHRALKAQCISEEEYLHHVLAHFCGTRHPADAQKRSWELTLSDPVGNAIREAALTSPSTRPDDIAQLKGLFESVRRDDVEAVKTIISHISDRAGQTIPLQAIATFAALHDDAGVLRLCLQMGASLHDNNTSIALEYATRSHALLDVLYEYDWQEMRTSKLAFNRLLEWSLHTGPEELNWFLSHGAKVDKDTIRHSVHGPPVKASCIKALIQQFGVKLFKGSRLLQSAAKRGRNDIVRVLLDAGMDVDELVGRPGFDDGECEATALYEAVYKKHGDTIELLLQYGADPEREVCGQSGLDTPLKLAEGHSYTEIVALLRRGMERHQPDARTWTAKL